jgi:hypothetical protein
MNRSCICEGANVNSQNKYFLRLLIWTGTQENDQGKNKCGRMCQEVCHEY